MINRVFHVGILGSYRASIGYGEKNSSTNPQDVIGASALACQIDLPRQTGDLDMSASVSLEELVAALPRLQGWKRNPKNEHEWMSPSGVKVDVLPAGPSLLAAGEIIWPGTGARMNLTGMRLALERGITFEVEPGLSIPVAPVAVIALLR